MILRLLPLAVLLCGCSTTLYSPASGGKLAVMQSDLLNVSYSGGGVTFHADKMSNSIPTRAGLLGANKIVGTVASAGVAIAVPGSGAAPLVSKAVISSVPHLSAPVAKPGD